MFGTSGMTAKVESDVSEKNADSKTTPESLDCLTQLALGAFGVKGVPRWLTMMLFWTVYVLQFGMTIVLLIAPSLAEDPQGEWKADGVVHTIEVAHACDSTDTYNLSCVVFLFAFSMMMSRDGVDFSLGVISTLHDCEPPPLGLACFGFLTVVFVVMHILMCIAFGRILGSGITADNVVLNAISIFIVLQIDDTAKDWLNSMGLVKSETGTESFAEARKRDSRKLIYLGVTWAVIVVAISGISWLGHRDFSACP